MEIKRKKVWMVKVLIQSAAILKIQCNSIIIFCRKILEIIFLNHFLSISLLTPHSSRYLNRPLAKLPPISKLRHLLGQELSSILFRRPKHSNLQRLSQDLCKHLRRKVFQQQQSTVLSYKTLHLRCLQRSWLHP